MSNFLQAEDTIDLNKADIKTLGKRMIQKNVTNGSGTSSMNVYYVTSRWGKMAINYLRTGRIPKFDLNLKK